VLPGEILSRNALIVVASKDRTPTRQLSAPVQLIGRRIYLIRGRRVMFDSDIAELYKVETRALIQAVQRNHARFPDDFMFQLSKEELKNWRSQLVISNPTAKMGLRRPPYAFTEHGVAMLSAILKSQRAVQMSILIIRAFVKIRELLASHKHLAARVEKLEGGQRTHASVINILVDEIEQMKKPTELPRRRIGFRAD
jgi:hypothetical protein